MTTTAMLSVDPAGTRIAPTPRDADGRYRYRLYIDGAFVDPAARRVARQRAIRSRARPGRACRAAAPPTPTAPCTPRTARSPSGAWPALSPSQRGALLRKLGDLITDNAEWLARVEMKDNGKLLAELIMQMRYMSNYYYYYGGLADKMEGAVIPIRQAGRVQLHEVRAGRRGRLHHAVELAAAAHEPQARARARGRQHGGAEAVGVHVGVAARVRQAGRGRGLSARRRQRRHRLRRGSRRRAGRAIRSWTASPSPAGRRRARMINEKAARHMKRVTMELGGKSPNIVFDDADLDEAVKGVVAGIFAASGQSCVAGSRLLVQRLDPRRSSSSRLLAFIATCASAIRPIPRRRSRRSPRGRSSRRSRRTSRSPRPKARAWSPAASAASVPGWPNGLFYEPTIFVDVDNRMRIAQEEVFGPVLSVIRFDDDDDAVRIANDTASASPRACGRRRCARALTMADRIRAGTVWVNNYRMTSTTSPFGGFKMSGTGREGGIAGMREYLEVKSVWISTGVEFPNPFVRR